MHFTLKYAICICCALLLASCKGITNTPSWHEIPIIPGATETADRPPGFSFKTKASSTKVQDYYETEMSKRGWKLAGNLPAVPFQEIPVVKLSPAPLGNLPTISPDKLLKPGPVLLFQRGTESAQITILIDPNNNSTAVLLGYSAK